MNYKFFIAKDDVCIPIESIESIEIKKHDSRQLISSNSITIVINNYHAECNYFPSGDIFLYSIDNQLVQSWYFIKEEMNMDFDTGKITISGTGTLKYLYDYVDIPSILKEWIREEKLKSIGI